MPAAPRFSPRIIGIGAAIVTVVVWSAFIVIARASAARSLTPLDLTFVRICGAALVLIPWGAWLVMQQRRLRSEASAAAAGPPQGGPRLPLGGWSYTGEAREKPGGRHI